MTATEHPRKRSLTLSVRLLLLVILALGAWMAWKGNRVRQQARAVAAIRSYGGFVHYDWEVVNGKIVPGRTRPEPAWLSRLLGDDFLHDVVYVSLVYDDSSGKRIETRRTDDSVLPHLRALTKIRVLLLQGRQATDNGIANLGGLTSLEQLLMWNASDLTDAGAAHLSGLKNLRKLHISNSQITDASLKQFARLPRVEELSLQGNHFTDRGLENIQGLRNLDGLYVGLGRCEITDRGLAYLQHLPRLRVLDIQNSRVTAEGALQLARLPKLTEIWRNGSQISNADIPKLQAKMPGLKVVQ
jgi:hypothetical protein